MDASSQISGLLRAHNNGDAAALSELFNAVYAELRRLSRSQLMRGATRSLDSTAVVHDLYIRLVRHQNVDWEDRRHFFAVAARAMRNLVIDYARRKTRLKRGGENPDLPTTVVGTETIELLALNEALTRLEAVDPRLAEAVQLRFFAGLSVEDTARVLDVTARTVRRDWRKARAFLRHELRGADRTPIREGLHDHT